MCPDLPEHVGTSFSPTLLTPRSPQEGCLQLGYLQLHLSPLCFLCRISAAELISTSSMLGCSSCWHHSPFVVQGATKPWFLPAPSHWRNILGPHLVLYKHRDRHLTLRFLKEQPRSSIQCQQSTPKDGREARTLQHLKKWIFFQQRNCLMLNDALATCTKSGFYKGRSGPALQGWLEPASSDWVAPSKSHLFHAALPFQQHFNSQADLSLAEHPTLALPQAQTAQCSKTSSLKTHVWWAIPEQRVLLSYIVLLPMQNSTGGATAFSSKPYLRDFINFCC